jgi:choline kinase
VKAIILSAGQGRRLLPLTRHMPKCLLQVGGRSVIEWQLRILASAGVDRVVVVVGFGAAAVERHLADVCPPGMRCRTLFNELYDRTDNVVSCAVASSEMQEDFLLLNGDTLIDPEIVTHLLTRRTTPVAMAVALKDEYDADDMKVSYVGTRVTRVGKDLARDETDGEAIGISLFRGRGRRLFVEALEDVLREPDGGRRWYLSAVDRLARRGVVWAANTGGSRWEEIDCAADLPRAEALATSWNQTSLGTESIEPIAVLSGTG